MTNNTLSDTIKKLPFLPGCYKYYDKDGNLLYVGKAKSLRKRVSSYFTGKQSSYKTKKLVSLIHKIEFTVTDSEHDALLLENALIKHFQPRFNISLKDDKTYPYIVIKNEHFPRVFFTRRKIKDGSEYLGPFTHVMVAKELLNLVKQNIPLRTCSLNLHPQMIAKGKYNVCLEYHLGNCKGPCEGYQTEQDYNTGLQQVRQILKGNLKEVIQYLQSKMMERAHNLEFEKAEQLKQKIESLKNYTFKNNVVNISHGELDIISLVQSDTAAVVNYMSVHKGHILHTRSAQVEYQLDETPEELIQAAYERFKDQFQSSAKKIVTNIPFEVTASDVEVKVPKVGSSKRLLDLSIRNAHLLLSELTRVQQKDEPKITEADLTILESLKQALHMRELPTHIECFDNSNFQGAYPVAGMVCYKNGKPSKKDYRHFKIKTVVGIDDFASMAEIVKRRYQRLSEEGSPLPQLVIIDGGKGQLNAAMHSIRSLNLQGQMTVIGLAKREESIFFPNDQEPLQLDYNSEALRFIRRIRDDVHHFAITFHRQQRSKGTLKNELEDIPGIGPSTITQLLKAFKTTKRIKEASREALQAVVGQHKAYIIYQYFYK